MTTQDSVRIFVRVTSGDLQDWLAGREVEIAGRAAQAVTQRARLALPEDDEEELEYAAMWWAAESPAAASSPAESLGPQSSAGPSADGRVVVAALDVPQSWVRAVGGEDPDRGFEVAVEAPLPRRCLVALHVDESQPSQDAESEPESELSWYDAGELAQVAGLAR